MEEPFQPAMEFLAQYPSLNPSEQRVTSVTTAKLVFIESKTRTDVCSVDYELVGQKEADGSTKVTTCYRRQGWVTE